MDYADIWTSDLWMVARTPVMVAVLVMAALLLHGALVLVIGRIARRTSTVQDGALLASVRGPLRWIMVSLALLSADNIVTDFREEAVFVAGIIRIIMPLLWGWLVIAIIRFVHGYINARADLSAPDNLTARRRRTRADILARIATVVVILISTGLLLLKIPEVREIGVALVASAGIAGLAFGIAAQPLLKNLVAGVQLAFTEPVRIDDVVVYQGEWGRIEKITLTYVVLKIWDDRRLVIPVSKLLDDTIENWTRETSHLLGSVMLYLDHAVDVESVRSFALEQVRSHRLWDKRVAVLQVTDMNRDVVELRILMSGRDGSELFEMRCDVREAVLRHIAVNTPEALNRNRLKFDPVD
jgi:small-conductance mechanosensitive channel